MLLLQGPQLHGRRDGLGFPPQNQGPCGGRARARGGGDPVPVSRETRDCCCCRCCCCWNRQPTRARQGRGGGPPPLGREGRGGGQERRDCGCCFCCFCCWNRQPTRARHEQTALQGGQSVVGGGWDHRLGAYRRKQAHGGHRTAAPKSCSPGPPPQFFIFLKLVMASCWAICHSVPNVAAPWRAKSAKGTPCLTAFPV